MEQLVHGSLPWNDGSQGPSPSPYEDLASAIVLQAVKDYIKAIRRLWDPKVSKPKKQETILEKLELEEFFHSGWYEFLCDIDPDKVIYNCRLRAEEQEKEAIRKQNKKKMNQLMKESVQRKEGITQ